MNLPPNHGINDLGLSDVTVRRLSPGDAHDVYALMAMCELQSVGEVITDEADIVGDWRRPTFDLARQSIGVWAPNGLIGYAEVYAGRRADAAVHPDHQGRGVGTALALWTQRVSRRDGSGLVGQAAPLGSAAQTLFQQLGYEPLWTSWVLRMPEGTIIDPQPMPAGYAIRSAGDDAER